MHRHILRSVLIVSVLCGVRPSRLAAEPWVGFSAFAIQSSRFQGKLCDDFLDGLDYSKNPAAAILFNTFGTDNTCLERFWRRVSLRGRKHLTEIHFSNEAGRRGGLLDENDFLGRFSVDEYNRLLEQMPEWLEERIRRRLFNIRALAAKGSGSGYFILSTGLEDNFTSLAWENLYRLFLEEWPSVIARNPALTRSFLSSDWQAPQDVYVETHGYRRRLDKDRYCIANGDGHDLDFLKDSGLALRGSGPASFDMLRGWIDRGRENGCILLIWAAKWQGIFHDNQHDLPKPLEREFQVDRQDLPLLESLVDYAQTED